MDDSYAKFFESNKENLKDSIVLVIGDHGNRYDSIRETVVGRLESRYLIAKKII